MDVNEVSVKWLKSLITNESSTLTNCPEEWKKYITKGINGAKILQANSVDVLSKKDQLPQDKNSIKMLKEILNFFKNNPSEFENCAIKIAELLDPNFINFTRTRFFPPPQKKRWR